MKKITLENLKANPDIKNACQTELMINGKSIEVSIDPDDVELEITIELANKIVDNFGFYETNARKRIIEEYFDDYNENWRGEDEPELNEAEFSENLILSRISFLSDSSIDFFYSENGMFGNHWLIAQSLDGENFEDTTMFG